TESNSIEEQQRLAITIPEPMFRIPASLIVGSFIALGTFGVGSSFVKCCFCARLFSGLAGTALIIAGIHESCQQLILYKT
ncbi:MAG TPA: hypothetical protein VHA52_08865, partial [Candidatus Babeliaceae bacterium]|nr:hypothetical protein [Candidatus Babeliaceae bacterium]